jgi:S-adenosylmethionine hydrolase
VPRTPERPRGCGVVTLLTDFGLDGHHAGVLHGVILGVNPAARVVDLSHGVPPGDLAHAAWSLLWSRRFFPPGTVHVAVVDPGVGTPRRAVAASAGGQLFVGPDNGVLSFALADAGDARAVSLPVSAGPGISATFHGRDVFAPAAARLSLGTPLARLGPPLADVVRLPRPIAARRPDGAVAGEIVAVDRWGNLVTSVTADDLRRAGMGPGSVVRVGRRVIRGLRRCYGEVAPGEAAALVNSNGHLEIAVNRGRADERFAAGRGTAAVVSRR